MAGVSEEMKSSSGSSTTATEEKKTSITPATTTTGGGSAGAAKGLWLDGFGAKLKPFANGGLSGLISSCLVGYPFYASGILIKFLQLKSLYGSKLSVSAYLHDPYVKFIVKKSFEKLPFRMTSGVVEKAAILGTYQTCTSFVKAANDGRKLTLYEELGCGFISGAVETVIASPLCCTYILMTREAAEGAGPGWSHRRMFHDLYHTAKKEGVLSLWRGAGVHAGCTMPKTVAMLPAYNHSFSYLKDSLGCSDLIASSGIRRKEKLNCFRKWNLAAAAVAEVKTGSTIRKQNQELAQEFSDFSGIDQVQKCWCHFRIMRHSFSCNVALFCM